MRRPTRRHDTARWLLRVVVPRVGRPLLSHAHARGSAVRLLRESLRHRGVELDLLPAADREHRALVGRARTRRLRVRAEARRLRHAPQEAARRGAVAPESPRPRAFARRIARADPRAAATALA